MLKRFRDHMAQPMTKDDVILSWSAFVIGVVVICLRFG